MSDTTLDQDDPNSMQEYVIAAAVILLFGLLYWFINHVWNDKEVELVATHQGQVHTSLSTADSIYLPQAHKVSTASAAVSTPTVNTQVTSPDIALEEGAKLEPLNEKQQALTVEEPIQVDAPKLVEEKVEASLDTPDTKGAEQEASPEKLTVDAESEADRLVYTLPDGTEVKIKPDGFEGAFKKAIINRDLNKPIMFDNIYFETGSGKVSNKSDHQIKATAALLNAYPDVKVLLRGHTDDRGDYKSNTQLSLSRANSMGLALVALGIEKRRITIEGMGEAEPIDSNKTEKGRGRNRRIEIVIIE